MTVYADVDGAVAIARLAAQFNWTWMAEDVDRFCERAGWEIAERRQFNVVAHTNLDVALNESSFFVVDRRFDHELVAAGHEITSVYTCVADLTASNQPVAEADTIGQYLQFRDRFEVEFGIAARATRVDNMMWEKSDVLIGLKRFRAWVHLQFINPVYQRTVDERAEDTDEEET